MFRELCFFATLLIGASQAKAQQLPVTAGTSEVRHPSWSKSANIYEVNIRQYTPEGTFRAFEAHLPRLRRMGVDVLWIMPVNPIARRERKGSLGSYYAVSDYTAINPEFGTMEDFRHLVRTAHAMGFKVILDWVANHTGWDHVWVEKHPDWYKRNASGLLEPYSYTDLSTGRKEVWSDVIGLDYNNAEVRAAMIDAMSFWLRETGIDGFRCDVAWTLPVDFWEQARNHLEAIKPVFMLAEADTPELQVKAFDMTYDWVLFHKLVDIAQGKATARDLATLFTNPTRAYPAGAYRMTFTSNHDENSWNGTDSELFGPAADSMTVLAATLPGMPLVYGGQEGGLDKRLKFFDRDPIVWKGSRRFALYRKLFKLKDDHPALTNGLSSGNLNILDAGNPSVFAFRRTSDADQVTVVVNLSSRPVGYSLDNRSIRTLSAWGWTIKAGAKVMSSN